MYDVFPEGYNETMNVKDRIRELRIALGQTQEQFAERCDTSRIQINHLETGFNKASSFPLRQKLATGLHLTTDELTAYFDGGVSLEETVRRIRKREAEAPAREALPNLALAAKVCTDGGIALAAVTLVVKRAADADLPVLEWIDLMRLEDLRLRRKKL